MMKDKVAPVTGASSGIGRAVALVWAREGARVVVSDTNDVGGEETVALVRAQGGEALFLAADVGQPKALLKSLLRAEGRPTHCGRASLFQHCVPAART